ncbi:MAG TPA: CCA tRNA nucleotidyltransferase, partial [Tepidisphaeraceae bacterium]|nr:CCA tRNA nucleotidyltransferase [Tepidisphaeraceae bacterium]
MSNDPDSQLSPEQSKAIRSNREDAMAVLRRLRDAGHVAYFAGGCVRDLLLGRTPTDYDVATDAPPARVRKLFSNTQAVGAAFGVILVRIRGSQIEVATFRAEAGYTDGRHPSQIHFTNAQHDAQRRDFTINGLFLDPISDKVIDYVGGQADLQAKTIRAIGDPCERFEEDHLRMLRAVRFAARLGFSIAPETETAIRDHAKHLTRISPERIAAELRIMLTPASRAQAYRLLNDLGLLELIFRFLKAPSPAGADYGNSLFCSTAVAKAISFPLALALISIDRQIQTHRSADIRDALSHAAIHRLVHALRQSLRISNQESDALAGILEGIEFLLQSLPPRVPTIKRFLARPTADDSRLMLDSLISADLLPRQATDIPARLEEFGGMDVAPIPWVNGDTLVAAGLAPGPLFKLVLDAVYDAQLEGSIHNSNEGVQLALKLAADG